MDNYLDRITDYLYRIAAALERLANVAEQCAQVPAVENPNEYEPGAQLGDHE